MNRSFALHRSVISAQWWSPLAEMGNQTHGGTIGALKHLRRCKAPRLMSVPDLPATERHSSLTRPEIDRLLSALEGARETLQASLQSVGLAERTVRGMGLRETSLSALHDPEKVTEFAQLQTETNSAFRQIQLELEAVGKHIESIKALIVSMEPKVSPA